MATDIERRGSMRPMPRPLPTLREAAAILARRRTRGLGWTPPGAGRALAATMKALDERFGSVTS